MEIEADKIQIEKYPVYKDSGVEWLGEIPSHWDITTLGKILDPVSIKNQPELPLLSITREKGVILRDLDDEEENHNFIPDDLSNYKVLGKGQFGMNKMKAWQGSYGISQYRGIVSPAYYVFKLFGEFDQRYFHLAIRSKLYVSFFGSASDGVRVGQWDLSKSRMKRIPFLMPPKKEQTTIAQFLNRKTVLIDKAIAIKEQQIELLKERRQILIHKAVTRGLNPHVKMKDSGVEWIGEIPESWKVSKLGHFIEILSGYAFPSSLFSNKPGVKLLRGINVAIGNTKWEETVYWPENKVQGLETYFLKENDIVFGMDRPLISGGMRIATIKKEDLPCLLLQRVSRIRSIKGLSQKYLLLIFRSKAFENYFSPILSGVSVPHISPNQIQSFKIGIPDLETQHMIISYLESQFTIIKSAISLKEKEIEKLTEYKTTLINSAVTGKIKVC